MTRPADSDVLARLSVRARRATLAAAAVPAAVAVACGVTAVVLAKQESWEGLGGFALLMAVLALACIGLIHLTVAAAFLTTWWLTGRGGRRRAVWVTQLSLAWAVLTAAVLWPLGLLIAGLVEGHDRHAESWGPVALLLPAPTLAAGVVAAFTRPVTRHLAATAPPLPVARGFDVPPRKPCRITAEGPRPSPPRSGRPGA